MSAVPAVPASIAAASALRVSEFVRRRSGIGAHALRRKREYWASEASSAHILGAICIFSMQNCQFDSRRPMEGRPA
jgi:hypothetical protein